jgi:glycosyltransferase involved in cell wall biosynthesis
MTNSPTISVLMSTYNTDNTLAKRALDSVLKQDYQNFELIIIDDGSDASKENFLLNYAIIHQEKVAYLRHNNCSQAKSINKGVKLSIGKYITIIDADDEYKTNHLSMCLKEIGEADLISTKTETIVDNEEDYYVIDKFDFSKVIHVDDCILFATLFGKRAVFENIDFAGEYGADANFYEVAATKYKVKKVDLRTYIYYRNIASSITSKKKIDNSFITLNTALHEQ